MGYWYIFYYFGIKFVKNNILQLLGLLLFSYRYFFGELLKIFEFNMELIISNFIDFVF